MEQEWAPPNDPVFRLVPATFEQQAAMLYRTLGQPVVSSATFWTVYQELLSAFHTLPANPQLAEALLSADEGADEEVPVLTGLHELRHGDNVVGEHGGLDNPPANDLDDLDGTHGSSDEEPAQAGVDLREYADFSD